MHQQLARAREDLLEEREAAERRESGQANSSGQGSRHPQSSSNPSHHDKFSVRCMQMRKTSMQQKIADALSDLSFPVAQLPHHGQRCSASVRQ